MRACVRACVCVRVCVCWGGGGGGGGGHLFAFLLDPLRVLNQVYQGLGTVADIEPVVFALGVLVLEAGQAFDDGDIAPQLVHHFLHGMRMSKAC